MSSVASRGSIAITAWIPEQIGFLSDRRPWVALILVLLACLPPLVVDLGQSETTSMEKLALVISQETWMRQRAGESNAWLTPSFNGTTRVTKPPLLVWLNMLSWSDLAPATSTTDQLTLRARLVSVTLALVTLGCTFWIGLTLGDCELALLAAVIAGSNILLRRQARFAAYDIHLTAWATLSVAASLWAMRPCGAAPTKRQQVLGWGIAGLGLAMAWLSKGPLAIAIVGLPVVGAIAIRPGRRVASAVGLCASLAFSAALAIPWYLYISHHVPDVGDILQKDYGKIFVQKPQSFYYYLLFFGLVFPWTLWLTAGLFLPFMRRVADRTSRVLIPWLWFAMLLVLFSMSTSKAERYILPIIPAFALLTANGWHVDEAGIKRGELIPGMRKLATLHWTVLLAVSLGFGPFVALQDWMVAQGWLSHAAVPPIVWPAALLASGLFIGLAVQGWRWHRCGKPLYAALATAAWTILGLTLLGHGSDDSSNQPLKAAAWQFTRLVGNAPVRYLRLEDRAVERPDMQFLFYAQRPIPALTPEEVPGYTASSSRVFVVAVDNARCDEIMRDSGFIPVTQFQDGRDSRRLWEHTSILSNCD